MTFRLPLFRLVASFAITMVSVSAQDQNLADLRHKAEAGDPIAQFDFARAYIAGKDVAKDPVEGLAWLRKSADQNYVGAEYALGVMYQTGLGVPKDQHEAANWFRKAARQQNKAAQAQLSGMLVNKTILPEEANWRGPEPTISQTPPQTLPHTLPSPQKDVKGKAAPFSLGEVETGLSGGLTSKRMATLVQKFGVDFKLSPDTRKRLADKGAEEDLLAAISASKRSL